MKIYKRECLGSGSGKCKDTGGQGWQEMRSGRLAGGQTCREELFQGSEQGRDLYFKRITGQL